MTTIAANKVAFIHYTLTDETGEELDSSRDDEPMPYLHGAGNIVEGLERRLEGKAVGDKVTAIVPPAEGYGEPSGMAPQPVPREAFEGVEPMVGMPLVLEDDDGNNIQLWIAAVEDDLVLLTHDHPLAGVTLHFDVEVMDIRDATESELHHGHAHSGDGHHHQH